MFLVVVLCSASVVFALLGLASSKPAMQGGPKLAVLKLNLERQLLAKQGRSAKQQNLLPSSNINAALPPDAPTFGHPIIAGIGVAGVGLGLAMQGMLGNLVAGLTIIFTKPYRVGEYIELLGVYGQVTDIELLSTKLIHADRSVVTIPNRKIIGEILHNYGTVRQLGLSVGVAYGADIARALSAVDDILQENPRVLKDPAPVVGISTLGKSSINISVQPWVKVSDYGPAQLELYQTIVEQFRAKHIDIPFPQSEVRLFVAPTTAR